MMSKQLVTHEQACSCSHSGICSFLPLQGPLTLGLGEREDFPFHGEVKGGWCVGLLCMKEWGRGRTKEIFLGPTSNASFREMKFQTSVGLSIKWGDNKTVRDVVSQSHLQSG